MKLKRKFLAVVTSFVTAVSLVPTAAFGGNVLAVDLQTATEQETGNTSRIVTSVSSVEPTDTTDSEVVQTTAVATTVKGTYESLTYIQYDDHVEVGSIDETVTEIIIPDEINGLPVTAIRGNGFMACRGLKSITMCDNITEIGYGAFYGCESLESVKMSENLEKIGINAFYICGNLKAVTIPGSVEYIDEYAFKNCYALEDLTISDGVKSILSEAFRGCKSLKNVVIPESVENISIGAFGGCTALEKVTILNPECEIDVPFLDGITICGYENSTAQEHAEEYGYTFEILEDEPVVTTTAVTTTQATTTTTTTTTSSSSIVTTYPIIMLVTSQTTVISIHGVYFTSVYVDMEAENVQIDKPGQTAEMTLTVCSQEGIVTPKLPDGIKLVKVIDEEGTEYTVNDDGTFETNGIDVTLTLEVDKSVQEGEYKLSFSFKGDKYVDTSTSVSIGGIQYSYICNEAEGGVLTIGEPVVSTSVSGTGTQTTTTTFISSVNVITSISIDYLYPLHTTYYGTVSAENVTATPSQTVKIPYEIDKFPRGAIYHMDFTIGFSITAPEGIEVVSVSDTDGNEYSVYDGVYTVESSKGYITIKINDDAEAGEYALDGKGYESEYFYGIREVYEDYIYSFSGGVITVDDKPVVTTTVLTTAATSTETTATSMTTTSTATEPIKITGDANGDNKTDVRDCAYIATLIAEGRAGELTETADFNGDGIVNVRDAAALARKLANNEIANQMSDKAVFYSCDEILEQLS